MAGISEYITKLSKRGLGAPIIVLLMLAMMILPMPPIFLDVMFTFNIALAMFVLLTTVYSQKILDFSSFPTVILIATLMRLSLNVASTRVVLLYGHTGPDAAGQVIESFASVVVGGNFMVGVIIFVILVTINFMVVTKGAGRVSEVSARFALDAMPGKQMAIDADLNAGAITQEDANIKRKEVGLEAEFHGSMDGASKFVKGDAVAGIIILFINVVGGIAVGMTENSMSFMGALHTYTLLAIGDALVAQVPALILSTATAIIVTRSDDGKSAGMGPQIISQLFGNYKLFVVTSGVLFMLGIVPGMPHVAFLSFSLIIGIVAYLLYRKAKILDQVQHGLQPGQQGLSPGSSKDLAVSGLGDGQVPMELLDVSWGDVEPVDAIGLEVGYRLIPLVDQAQDGQLMARIKGVRKKLSQELGFLIPAVHIRDNLELPPNAYRVLLQGVSQGTVEVYPDREMAINPGQVYGAINGYPAKDPAYGLEAVWIEGAQKDEAQTFGFTVVDPSTVIATHLSQIISDNASLLLGYEEVQQLLDRLAESSPKLVESLVPDILPLHIIVKVLQNLLEEHVPIKDMRRIAETLAEYGLKTQDPDLLVTVVRVSLSKVIVQDVIGTEEEIAVITLAPELEKLLQQTLSSSTEGAGIEPGLAEQIQSSLSELIRAQEQTGEIVVLLVSAPIRSFLSRFFRHSLPSLIVLSYQEIPDDKQIKVVGVVGQT